MEAPVDIPVHIPTILAHCTGGRRELHLRAGTLGDALDKLWAYHPLLHHHFHDKEGGLRPHVLIFFNQEDIRGLKNLDLSLKKGDSLTLMQAVSGGAPVRPYAESEAPAHTGSPTELAGFHSGEGSVPA